MGRPRTFDPDTALEAALGVFWCKGYEGASYTDLVAATGVERPALYSAFGNKESLFLRALDRYSTIYWAYVPAALAKPTAFEVVESFLSGAIDLNTRFPERPGCMGVTGALATSDEGEPIRKTLIEARAEGETALRERFEQAKADGDLPADADCAVLAAYLMAVVHGITVQAKAGFPKDKLQAVASHALANWPARP